MKERGEGTSAKVFEYLSWGKKKKKEESVFYILRSAIKTFGLERKHNTTQQERMKPAHLSKHGDCTWYRARVKLKSGHCRQKRPLSGIFSPTWTIVLYIRVWSLTLGSPCHRTVDKINGDVRRRAFFLFLLLSFFFSNTSSLCHISHSSSWIVNKNYER